jgi:hypothetical protein
MKIILLLLLMALSFNTKEVFNNMAFIEGIIGVSTGQAYALEIIKSIRGINA